MEHPAVNRSRDHDLYDIYLPRMAHPYVTWKNNGNGIEVTWKDLRYLQDPLVDLYALRFYFDSQMRIQHAEFRERWNTDPVCLQGRQGE